jgi:hypothetical protein
MKRAITYLIIFTIFFWSAWFAVAWLTQPVNTTGYNVPVIAAFIMLLSAAVGFALTTIIAAINANRTNRKIPKLLVQDSLLQGLIGALGTAGLLMLQLLRVATTLNLILWLAIVISIEWYLFQKKSKLKT